MTTAPFHRLRLSSGIASGITSVTLVSLMVLTGCSDKDNASHNATRGAAPSEYASLPSTTQSSNTDAAQNSAVLAAYNAMTSEQAKAYKQASAKGTDLKQYANLNALSKIEIDLARMQQVGTVVRGEIGHEAKVSMLDLQAKPPRATVSDCVDLSKYQTYDTRAKKVVPLPSEQPLRYVATARVEQWDGRWLVTDIDTQGGSTC